jgi:APA family basic amino acid/polyamine antiporter
MVYLGAVYLGFALCLTGKYGDLLDFVVIIVLIFYIWLFWNFYFRKKCQMQSVRIKHWLSIFASTVYYHCLAICMRYCIQNHTSGWGDYAIGIPCIIWRKEG